MNTKNNDNTDDGDAFEDDFDDEDSAISDLNPDGTRYLPRRRVVHIDLKGAPPKVSYLKSLFPLVKRAGATHLLMEYEDMFPFEGKLENISATNAYSKADLKLVLDTCRELEFEVIPLIQTFGE